MAGTEIKPIRQIAKTGDNWAGRGSTDGTYLYIPTVTAGIATLSKYDTQGNLIWERNLSNSSAGSTSSTSPDGSILVASNSGGSTGKTSALARFNSAGDKLWEVTDSYPSIADVAVSGSTVYVSGGSGTGFNSANTAFINAYSLDNGTLLWSKKYPNSGASSIGDLEIVDGSIYVAASLYGKQDFDTGIAGKLDLNGNEIWWKSAPANDWNAVWSVRIVGDELLGIGYKGDGGDRGDTRLISFNKNNGTILWDKSWGDNNQQGSGNIEILNGKVYVSHGDGVAWNSSAVSGGYSVVDELDASGTLLNTYKFDVPSANDGAASLIKVGNSLYMLGSTNGTIQGHLNGGGYDVYIASVVVAPKPIVRGNSIYTIVDGPSWTQAEANSVKLGGHLTSIGTQTENTFLKTGFSDVLKENIWIGLSDHAQEGSFKWSNGDPVAYQNWNSPEPNNLNNQDYVQLYTNGEWDDFELRNNGIGEVNKGIAETPFIRRGDSGYVIVSGPTWEEAEANAVKLGGHLVTINDKEENEYIEQYVLSEYLNDRLPRDAYGHSQVHIGLSRNPVNNNSIKNASGYLDGWTDNSSNSWRPSYWGLGGTGGEHDGDYTHLMLGWSDHPLGNVFWNDAPLNHSYARGYGLAEIKLAPNNTPTGTPTVTGTFKVGSTLTIDTSTIKDSDNFTGYSPTFKYNWETSTDGTTWSKLTSTDGADNNNTYILTAAEVSKKIRGVVSYLDAYGTNEVVNSSASIIEADTKKPIIRGNSLYTIVDGPSWTQAEANSVKLGGHLVTINDSSEDKWVFATFKDQVIKHALDTGYSGTKVSVLIGLNDEKEEGRFEWSSNERVSYTNWSPGQPQGGLSDEDYVGILLNWLDPSRWGDLVSDFRFGDENIGIAETPFIRRGDSAYVIVSGPTWEEAEANAVKLGGHLVTINDAAENNWVYKNVYLNRNDSNGLWLGGTDKEVEGRWQWADGTPWAFSSFANNDNHPVFDPVNGEDYLQYNELHSSLDGGWNDISNGYPSYPFKTIGGIAEIKLAPNNTSTGTPTLSGTTKVGQVITIDKTPIQDADNFTGYTPDFKYTWEIANDPGMTMMIPVWESLKTADATDSNETFTITADLTGKLIRGVVSYMDGYGTQESVASTASAPITSGAPPVQSLTLTAPSKSAIRAGTNTTSAIAYNVSTGETSLTGVGASLYFDSTQLTVTTAGEPFKTGLLGSTITADTTNADGDPKTDKVLSLTYADFGGNFPGSGTTLPLTLANLNLVPTATYTGTTLHLKSSPASGYTATGADLTLGYNASPIVNSTLPALTTNRGSAFSYTVPSTLFSDSDSTLTFSASTATGASLPSWLSFNPATRTLSGTPITGGTVNLNLSASDELGSVSTPLSIKVREVQQLSSSTSTIRYQRNKDFTLPINYSTTDGSSSTGLAFKVHFNSSLFSFNPSTGVSNKLAAAGLFEVGAVQQDTGDSDNDPTTDQYIPISLASFTGQLPSGSKLADLTFRSADKAIDPITGLRDTSINFSESSVASGYGFSGSSASLKPLSFNLDVDGDGLVTPLGDGLMVIRYLFGNAFAGDSLINKAISPDSPLLGGIPYASMTTQQKLGVASLVATNIQQGIDSKLLDVDKDGMTTPLGDGLMVIRRLFGSAFDGAALTSKAISPESPYFGPPAAFAAVAANIDALKPTMSVM